MLLGSFIGIYQIKDNLFPTTVNFNGALPENMIHDYFSQFKDEELDKEYLATQIESYNSAMLENKSKIEQMSQNFINSSVILILTLFIFAVVACLISFAESSNT